MGLGRPETSGRGMQKGLGNKRAAFIGSLSGSFMKVALLASISFQTFFTTVFLPPQHCQRRARKMPFTTTDEAFRWFLGTNSMVVSGGVCGTSMLKSS